MPTVDLMHTPSSATLKSESDTTTLLRYDRRELALCVQRLQSGVCVKACGNLLLSMSMPSLLGKRSSPRTLMRSTDTPLQCKVEGGRGGA
jgi:hypothetical protein